MTVALVLAGEADAGLCGQLAALGVRRVDVLSAGRRDDWCGCISTAAHAKTCPCPVRQWSARVARSAG